MILLGVFFLGLIVAHVILLASHCPDDPPMLDITSAIVCFRYTISVWMVSWTIWFIKHRFNSFFL